MFRSCPLRRLSKNRKLISKVFIDIGMGVTLLASLITGLVEWLVFPSGKQSGSILFLGVTKHLWSDIHLYSSLIFTGLLVIHFALNYRLFKSMARCIFK